MSEKNKHWRDVYKSDFLATWDLDKNVILTIKEAKEQECKLAKGKEIKLVLHFIETVLDNGVRVKPMICIPTNCKMIQMRTGLQFFKDWSGLKVEIGSGENKGGVGNSTGLRIFNVLVEVDIKFILDSKDLIFVRNEANKLLRSLTDEQKEDIKNHITQLSSV